MHLIKSHLVREADAPTPENVFAAKYEWLLRWAMHFTQNDRHIAEDLVQEAFVQLILSWDRFKDNISQIEPFLYSTLKYAHLIELRRGRRFNFQDLALIEFDDLRLSLKEEQTTDPIEVQDDLRRIVAYLCWRKRSAKSASILLLRFFHGYFPDEIVRIALMKRGVVSQMLTAAREEVKAYLNDPSRIEIMRQGKPPELMPRRVAVPPDQFAEELRTTIFQARTTACLDRSRLLQHYQAITPKPISGDLLAHIVSCERCLNTINSIFNFPSPLERTAEGMAGPTRRSRRNSGSTGSGLQEQIRRSIAGGKDRLRKVYEHHPRGLMILVNGEVLAMRDVNSATSELKIQTTPEKSLGIINVLSEQGIFLLTMYVPSTPPEAPPELRHEVALSDDRKLELLLRFTSEGAVIELHYNDPLFLPAANEQSALEVDEEWGDAAETLAVSSEAEIVPATVAPRRQSWWRRILHRMSLIALPEMNPMLATAMVCAVAAIVFLSLSYRASSVMKPEELLTRAATSENASARSGMNGVVVQAVRIQTPHRKLERTLYRDVQGKRHLKDRALSHEDAVLDSQLETFGIPWDDPLSASSFRDWHDHVAVGRDVVKRRDNGLLTLTTTVADGAVASESLTVREADFHPVGRSIELRNDAGTVEIAELNYSVLPWTSVNPDLFDSLASVPATVGSGTHASLLPHLPTLPSAVQVDEAELGVRLVLSRLHLDANAGIELSREADGVHVQGVVDTDDEKHQLQSQLHLVPHVFPSILTVREMAAKPTAGSEITSIQQSSVAAAAPSSLERYFTERNMDRTGLSATTQQFMDSSFAVKHESEQIAGLLDRFSSNAQLSTEARTALSELLIEHKAKLLEALGKEERQLVGLQLIPHPATAPEVPQGNVDALRTTADRNFSLCVELISATDAPSRPPQATAFQLATSIAQLRAVALHISAAAQMEPPSFASAATANQNK